MSLSSPFIHRPIATSLLAAALLLAGLVAYTVLPVAPLPNVEFPTIQVNVQFPGASPETMASSVAMPLERQFGHIAGIAEITSTSSLGATAISLQFELTRDVDAAARDVQSAIAAAASDLPPNLPLRPTYRKVNPADAPILILSLSSETIPLSVVYDQANTILAQKISQVPGVGQVFVGGGQQPAVRIDADPIALAGIGLSLDNLRNIVAGATAEEAKGMLANRSLNTTLTANDQLLAASEYANIVISAQNGGFVRLGDLAKVTDDVQDNRVAGWMNGKRAVQIIIRRQPGANILETNDRIRALLPDLSAAISPAIDVEVSMDRTETIRASVRDVEVTLLLSVLLVTLVVFAFLRSARATVIPAIAVPLSLIGTFGVMFLLGFSLDNLSLMALTIATGFVIDDAIVVTENIARHVELGTPPYKAALEGAKEIGFTIVSITLSLLAVFIPILLMQGIVGRLFREFAVTLSVAVALSALISLTLTPMMAARLIATREARHGRLYRASERAFSALLHGYEVALRWVLRHRVVMLTVTLVTIGFTGLLYVVIPKGLFPDQDTGLIMGFSEAPQEVSFRSMRERQEAINAAVREDPDIDHMISFIGGGYSAAAINTGTMFIALKPRPPRKATAFQIIDRLRRKLSRVEGITLYLQAVQDVRVGGRTTRTTYQYTLQDIDLDELDHFAPRALARLRKIPELRDVATDQQSVGLELDVDIDRDTASRLGVTPRAIDDLLYDAFGQRQIATYFTETNQYRVVLEATPELASFPESIQNLYADAPDAGPVRLDALVQTSVSQKPLSINHQGQFPSVTLSFNTAPGVSLGDAVDKIHQAERDIGLPPSIRASFSGTAQAFEASLRSEPVLVAAALIAVYIVLGVLYESTIHPITILSTIPSAGIGALLALLLLRTDSQRDGAHRHHLAHRHREEERHLAHRLRPRRGAKAGALSGEGDLRGVRAALPSHPDDDARGDHGRAPPGAGERAGLGAAAAAGHRHRGRAAGVAARHDLLDAGGVSGARSLREEQRGGIGPRRRGSGARREHRRRLVDLHQDRGDVVLPAAVVRELDEPPDRRVAAEGHDRRDVGVVEVPVEAVAAEEEARARLDAHDARVDLDVLAVTDGARDDVAVRGPLRLLRGDEALVHLPGDERVVLGELLDAPRAT